MNTDAWITLTVVGVLLATLIAGRIRPSLSVFAATATLLATGVIDQGQALAGFANPAPMTIAALYVVATAVERTGALTPVFHSLLGRRAGVRAPLARLMMPATGASAFLNNTPIMAILIPQVSSWADRYRISVSRLLMPLSFAIIIGGTMTVIGTSTNLVIAGLVTDSGIGPMGFFDVGKLGLPIALVGLPLLVLLAPVLLPARRSARAEVAEETRRFTAHMVVVPGGPIDGKTVEAADLRELPGGFLVSVDRGDSTVAPVSPTTVLRGGNVLRFVGLVDQILDLRDRRGLVSAEQEHLTSLTDPGVRYFEAVVGPRSPLVGSTLRDVDFRSYYQAAVVAIHRSGHLVEGKLGRIPVRIGDTLILLSDPGFRDRWRNREDFLLIAGLDSASPKPGPRAWLSIVILLAVVVLAATGTVDIMTGAVVGALAVIALRILSVREAVSAIDLDVIVLVASAFGIAAAMETTGLAQQVADGLASALSGLGVHGVLLGIVLATMVLTEMISNNAAALLMFPIGMGVAAQTGLDPMGTAVAIAVSASMSFLTPIGYQTNTMVYGPGGYRFGDYLRLGWPLTLAAIVVIVGLTPALW